MPATHPTSNTTVLPHQARIHIVFVLLNQVYAATLDNTTAALIIHALGMTGNTDHIAHALAARYMALGLADGTIAPNDVDDSFTCNREQAHDALIEQYQHEIDDSVVALATVRPIRRPDLTRDLLTESIRTGPAVTDHDRARIKAGFAAMTDGDAQ